MKAKSFPFKGNTGITMPQPAKTWIGVYRNLNDVSEADPYRWAIGSVVDGVLEVEGHRLTGSEVIRQVRIYRGFEIYAVHPELIRRCSVFKLNPEDRGCNGVALSPEVDYPHGFLCPNCLLTRKLWIGETTAGAGVDYDALGAEIEAIHARRPVLREKRRR
jgi:hypothetical protein